MRLLSIVLLCTAACAFAQSKLATVITKAELDAAVARTPKPVVIDQQLKMVNIEGEYNLAIASVARTKGTGSQISGSLTHSDVAEIYHIISGSGTLVSGGAMENSKAAAADSSVVKLAGPSNSGGDIKSGTSRKVGPGDVLIVPPKMPHWFSEITSDLVYLVVRIDPHKLLPPEATGSAT